MSVPHSALRPAKSAFIAKEKEGGGRRSKRRKRKQRRRSTRRERCRKRQKKEGADEGMEKERTEHDQHKKS